MIFWMKVEPVLFMKEQNVKVLLRPQTGADWHQADM